MSSTDPHLPGRAGDEQLASAAAATIAERSGLARHDVAVVLGSGWGAAEPLLGAPVVRLAATEVPGFHPAAVSGHSGTIASVAVHDSSGHPSGRHALVLAARTHLYEDRGVAAVAHGVRTAAAAGCRTVVLTNGAGSVQEHWPPGTAVLIADHLNLTGVSPLSGPSFVDLTDLYSQRLRQLAREVDPNLAQGVYAQFRGPQYETPAEVRMARVLGADLVGMSTAIEAVAARAAGLEVLGLSLVTNAAAGITAQPLTHGEVLAAGAAAAPRLGALLAAIVGRLVHQG